MLKGMSNNIIAAAVALITCLSCARGSVEVPVNQDAPIYPDYMGVTIPYNIAPLNFHYTATGIRKAATTVTCNGLVRQFNGVISACRVTRSGPDELRDSCLVTCLIIAIEQHDSSLLSSMRIAC